jgi:hypothetical protein
MSKARLERVQLARRQMSDLVLKLGSLANDAADRERGAALHAAAVHAAHAALDLQAIVDRDAALAGPHAADYHEDNCSLAAQEARRNENR